MKLLPAILASLLLTTSSLEAAETRLNVLFIAVDDLRPTLGCYEDPIALSPNIDRLARRGVVFRRAYCQQALCSPSRLSMLTGMLPDTIRVWDLKTHFRRAVPDAVTLPQHFKQNGYHTLSLGKVFHGNGEPAKDPPSWSEPARYDIVTDVKLRYALPKNRAGNGRSSTALVETLDIYPTLAEACGLNVPDELEGASLCPLLDNPAAPGRAFARSLFPRDRTKFRHQGPGDIMGHALRTDRFRFVQWRGNASGNVVAEELYDHQRNQQETVNVADRAEYASTLKELRTLLKPTGQ